MYGSCDKGKGRLYQVLILILHCQQKNRYNGVSVVNNGYLGQYFIDFLEWVIKSKPGCSISKTIFCYGCYMALYSIVRTGVTLHKREPHYECYEWLYSNP